MTAKRGKRSFSETEVPLGESYDCSGKENSWVCLGLSGRRL